MEGNAVGKVAEQYWISFNEQIIFCGESLREPGVLSVRPGSSGELRARLRVMGLEVEESVKVGNDIAIGINDLKLFIGVEAVNDRRMLVTFGITPGSRVNVTIDAGAGFEEDAQDFPREEIDANEDRFGCAIGFRETRPRLRRTH
jgi:Fe2+ transport system protein FeoA